MESTAAAAATADDEDDVAGDGRQQQQPRRITQALGGEHEYNMRELFDAWGLPPKFREGVARSWRCRIVPMATDERQERDFAIRGVPFLASPEHARGVFDAMKPTRPAAAAAGDDRGAVAENEAAVDAVSWACDSEWSTFPRPKVAMVGGWGAPGSHLLSERHMRMVHSFGEVVDGDVPLNLQMFHRDDTSVPVLPSHLRWPLPEFFSTDPPPPPSTTEQVTGELVSHPSTVEDETVEDERGRREKTNDGNVRPPPTAGKEEEVDHAAAEVAAAEGGDDDDFKALPAQGAIRKTGGVGVPLDMATRLSAAGALTWWHLDDCGEFVFQVGLPLDLNESRRRRRRLGGDNKPNQQQPLLLGPTGKPVVKLFVFAEKEDYEWIAQDGVMNSTMKQSALDLFNTPDHHLPQDQELVPPFSAVPLENDGIYRSTTTSSDHESAGAEAATTSADGGGSAEGGGRVGRCGNEGGGRAAAVGKLPTFWVAPLEAGGCPLLSPPNVIHLVLTVRDCVMVEERRLSLMFLDEVHYFQRRAERWCEPPVQYRFLREDLVDPKRCRVAAVLPLLHALRAGMTTSKTNDGGGGVGGVGDESLSGGAARDETKEGKGEGEGERDDDDDEEDEEERDAMVTAAAAKWGRAKNALEVLVSDRERYALDDVTREEVVAALRAADEWLAPAIAAGGGIGGNGDGGGGSTGYTMGKQSGGGTASSSSPSAVQLAAAAFVAADPRSARAGPLLSAMSGEGEKNVHRLGFFSSAASTSASTAAAASDDVGAPFCAVVHEKGRPRWGPVRATREEAARDRKEMRRAVKEGTLDATLRRWRSGLLPAVDA